MIKDYDRKYRSVHFILFYHYSYCMTSYSILYKGVLKNYINS